MELLLLLNHPLKALVNPIQSNLLVSPNAHLHHPNVVLSVLVVGIVLRNEVLEVGLSDSTREIKALD